MQRTVMARPDSRRRRISCALPIPASSCCVTEKSFSKGPTKFFAGPRIVTSNAFWSNQPREERQNGSASFTCLDRTSSWHSRRCELCAAVAGDFLRQWGVRHLHQTIYGDYVLRIREWSAERS